MRQDPAVLASILLISLGLHGGCRKAPEPRTGGETATPATSTEAPDDSAVVRKAIDVVNTNLVDGAITGNSDLAASCFTSDGALLLPTGASVVGRDSIRSVLRRLLLRYDVSTGRTETRTLRVIEGRAYETGKWSATAGAIGGKAKADSGSYVNIWKKEAGAWRLWRVITMSRAG